MNGSEQQRVKTSSARCWCGVISPALANPELTERWLVQHFAAWHPEHLPRIRSRLVAGTVKFWTDRTFTALKPRLVVEDIGVADLETLLRL